MDVCQPTVSEQRTSLAALQRQLATSKGHFVTPVCFLFLHPFNWKLMRPKLPKRQMHKGFAERITRHPLNWWPCHPGCSAFHLPSIAGAAVRYPEGMPRQAQDARLKARLERAKIGTLKPCQHTETQRHWQLLISKKNWHPFEAYKDMESG